MTSEDELRRLLTEIRDIQRDHLAEYRRVTERSLDLQQRAVTRQEQMVQVYRRLLVFGGGMMRRFEQPAIRASETNSCCLSPSVSPRTSRA